MVSLTLADFDFLWVLPNVSIYVQVAREIGLIKESQWPKHIEHNYIQVVFLSWQWNIAPAIQFIWGFHVKKTEFMSCPNAFNGIVGQRRHVSAIDR